MTATPPHTERLRWLANTLDVEDGVDELRDLDAAAAWMAERGLDDGGGGAAAATDLERLRRLREVLRAGMTANHEGEPMPQATVAGLRALGRDAPLRVDVTDDGEPVLVPADGAAHPLVARLLADLHRAMQDGSWSRLKICRNGECAWAFYDASRNRSGKWCDMAVCGNRVKVRTYRERHADGSPDGSETAAPA